jgi:hypothetical protein
MPLIGLAMVNEVLRESRIKSGSVAIAALLCLWGTIEFFAFELNYQRKFRDQFEMSQQLSRFEKVPVALPEDAVVGYLTDLQHGTLNADAMFGEAQYALAPRILQWGTGHGWVLGNFTGSGPFTGDQHGLRLERDFGNGVVLFRREAP